MNNIQQIKQKSNKQAKEALWNLKVAVMGLADMCEDEDLLAHLASISTWVDEYENTHNVNRKFERVLLMQAAISSMLPKCKGVALYGLEDLHKRVIALRSYQTIHV